MLVAAVFGLAAAAAVSGALPRPRFSATAIVEIDSADPAARLALAQASRETVVAKPVLLRAATALIASGEAAPRPDMAERLAVTVGLAGSHATGRDARLAAMLPSVVEASPGAILGTIDVTARDSNPDAAARIATAVGEAFVADQDDRDAETRRQHDAGLVARLAAARTADAEARARFPTLGGVSVDPVQARAAAASATIAAQKRVDLIHTIMAAGTPPVSDRRDVPDQIAAVQRTYLDLVGQLTKARETLGDRHMTIISLRESVARAAVDVSGAWKRLERSAREDLETARGRETRLRGTDTPTDVARRAKIEDARAAVQQADEALATAQAAKLGGADAGRAYRLITGAPVPAVSRGVPTAVRGLLAALAGLVAFFLTRAFPPASGRVFQGLLASRAEPTLSTEPSIGPVSRAPVSRAPVPRAPVSREPTPVVAARPVAAPQVPARFFDSEDSLPVADLHRRRRPFEIDPDSVDTNLAVRPAAAVDARRVAAPRELPRDPGLREAARVMVARFETLDPQFGVPTVMVGATDLETVTSSVSMTLALAAAAIGRRVLVVESNRPVIGLAAAADCAAEPMLVDVFGSLRVALPAEDGDGMVQVAPSIEGGARIAADLARHGGAPLVEDLGDAFDLVIVDGRDMDETIPVDAYFRIARFASARDDQRFLAICDASPDAFLGTIVGGVFVPGLGPAPTDVRDVEPAQAPAPAAEPEAMSRPARAVERWQASPRRRVAAR